MSDSHIKNKMPIKITYRNSSYSKINKKPKNKGNYNYLNSFVYEYPISLLKESSQFEKYKERLILSGKPKPEKILLNKNYHHIAFKSHTNNIFLNPKEVFSKFKNKNILKLYKNIFKNMEKINTAKSSELKNLLPQNIVNNIYSPNSNSLKKNKSFSNLNLNTLYQKVYLNQIERRGFNYNKIKMSQLQRNAMNSFSKLDEDFLDNDIKDKSNFVLEANNRKNLPKIKTYMINKFNVMKLRNEYLNEKKFKKYKPKPVINIKNDPNFKFHVFRDIKGNVRDLGKPYRRSLKMTDIKMRDLNLINKIKQVRDPEIIEKFKTTIL